MTKSQLNYLDNLNEWGVPYNIGVEQILGKGWRERASEIPNDKAEEAITEMLEKLSHK